MLAAMVEWRIERFQFGMTRTMGRLMVNGKRVCDVLEDTDRGLRQDMPLAEITAKKVPGQTAIPHGRYHLCFAYSPKFGRDIMTIEGIPGFEGIRIHAGNTEADTEGCPLLGMRNGNSCLRNSRKCVEKVEDMLLEAGGEAMLTILPVFN